MRRNSEAENGGGAVADPRKWPARAREKISPVPIVSRERAGQNSGIESTATTHGPPCVPGPLPNGEMIGRRASARFRRKPRIVVGCRPMSADSDQPGLSARPKIVSKRYEASQSDAMRYEQQGRLPMGHHMSWRGSAPVADARAQRQQNSVVCCGEGEQCSLAARTQRTRTHRFTPKRTRRESPGKGTECRDSANAFACRKE